jgi:hypothetical protein
VHTCGVHVYTSSHFEGCDVPLDSTQRALRLSAISYQLPAISCYVIPAGALHRPYAIYGTYHGPLSSIICYLLFISTGVVPVCQWCWCSRGRGALSSFLGCSLLGVGPLPVRKCQCHQMPSKEHMQLGWVVRWVLSAPPGHPAAGRCGRVACRASASASLAPLYSPCASPAFDRGSKPPSRSALAPVGSSPGPVLSPVTALQFQPVCS